jgi:immune inhibitor A
VNKQRSFCLIFLLTFTCLTCIAAVAVGAGLTYLTTIPPATEISPYRATNTPAPAGQDYTPTPELPAETDATVVLRPTPTPNSTPNPALAASRLDIADPVSAEALESEQSLGQAEVPQSNPLELAERLKGLHNLSPTVADHADRVAVGTVQTFHASNQDTEANFTLSARMRYATAHVYFWVDSTVNVADRDIRQLTDYFESKIYPTDREFFGSEWSPGVDGDVHIYILYASGLGSTVGGFFSSADEYPPSVNPFSNAHEMFYVNADNQELNSSFTAGVLAHEFQHMIHWNQDRNEDAWLNEGSSELAVALNKLDLGGFDQEYLANPNIPLINWPSMSDVDTTPWYGGAFLFMDYFLGRFGEATTQSLIHNQENGMKSVDAVLQQSGTMDPLTNTPLTGDRFLSDMAASLIINDTKAYGGVFSFTKYGNVPSATVSGKDQIIACPSKKLTGSMYQYGIRYYRIRCIGDFQVAFAGQSSLHVLPTDAPQGKYMVWSNRGDESDMTLTRSFDLPAGPAKLQYQIWYDLEKGWDYAYVEISDDGGGTWKVLRAPSSSATNPQGNNYGWGWTGESGSGDKAGWLNESIDLSTFAGRTVQIRFEYITDAAVNQEGLILDNIRIPEINYEAGFEDGLDGWDAKGFVRLQNVMPQTYQVVFIKQGTGNTIERLALDDRQFGSYPFSLKKNEDLLMIVIPTSRFTTQTANYQWEILAGK